MSPAPLGGAPRRALPVGNSGMQWSPDGLRVAVVALPGAFGGWIWIIEPASAAPPRKLLDLPGGVFFRGLAWSRDGSSLILGRIQQSGDIFLAERSDRP